MESQDSCQVEKSELYFTYRRIANMTIGKRISNHRKYLNLSQEELGDKLSVSRQAVYKWEADISVPDSNNLIELSRLFDISIGELIGEDRQVDSVEPQVEFPKLKVPFLLWVLVLFLGIGLIFQFVNLNKISNKLVNVEGDYGKIQNQLDLIGNRIPTTPNNSDFLKLTFAIPKYKFKESSMDLKVDLSLVEYSDDTKVFVEIQNEIYPLAEGEQNKYSQVVTIPLSNYFYGNILIVRNGTTVTLPFYDNGVTVIEGLVRGFVSDATIVDKDIVSNIISNLPVCYESPCAIEGDFIGRSDFINNYSIDEVERIIKDDNDVEVMRGSVEEVESTELQDTVLQVVRFNGAVDILKKDVLYSIYYKAIYDDSYVIEVLDGKLQISKNGASFMEVDSYLLMEAIK